MRMPAAALCGLLLICGQAGPVCACTSFCLDTTDGPLFAANCDLTIPGDGLVFVNQRGIAKEAYRANTLGEKARWISAHGSVTFSLAGRELVWGGMNEAGLVVTTLQLTASKCANPDERHPMGAGFLLQYVLDTCGSVEDAIHTFSEVMPWKDECNDHFLIADATGNCAGIEFLDGRFVCHTGEDLPVKAMSNMPYKRALAAYERGGPRWWWSNPGRSAERFAGAASRSKNYDAARDTNAVAYAFETLTRVVAAPHTKWSIVWGLTEREIWFRSAASPSVKHLALDSFDFSCDAPLLMLNVNAIVSSDVEPFFRPYDPEVNRAVFSTFCDRWGIDVSAEDTEWLMQHFEGFECAR